MIQIFSAALIIICLISLYYYSETKENFIKLAFRLFLGVIFVSSGLGKLSATTEFPTTSIIGPVYLEKLLAPHGLAFFAKFVAFSQIAIGLLMFSTRMYLIGSIMLMPMLICILIVTISMNFSGTEYIVLALILMNLCLLMFNWYRLKPIIFDEDKVTSYSPPYFKFTYRDYGWAIASIIILVGASIIRFETNVARILIKFSIISLLFLAAINFYKRKKHTRSKTTQSFGDKNAQSTDPNL